MIDARTTSSSCPVELQELEFNLVIFFFKQLCIYSIAELQLNKMIWFST